VDYFKVIFLQLSEEFWVGRTVRVTVTFLILLGEIRRGGLQNRQEDF